ncbi:unnamed protein product, partial [Symbiodinium microadriaticum]
MARLAVSPSALPGRCLSWRNSWRSCKAAGRHLRARFQMSAPLSRNRRCSRWMQLKEEDRSALPTGLCRQVRVHLTGIQPRRATKEVLHALQSRSPPDGMSSILTI